MPEKAIVFIIGAGRSGTSALTRVLSLCGCTLPEAVRGAHSDNPKGYWEPVEGAMLNRSFEIQHGTFASDPTVRFQECALEEQVKEDFVRQLQSFLSRCPRADALVVKNPSITTLMQFWLEAARREGFSTKVAICIRHPGEWHASMASMGKRGGVTMSVEWANAAWLKLNLLAERYSRGLPRVFIEYRNLVADWRAQIPRLQDALAIELTPDETAIDEFLTPGLYRQRCAGAIKETFGYSWTRRVYEALRLAARDRPLDVDALDEIYQAYHAFERSFRMANEEFEAFKAVASARNPNTLAENATVWIAGRDF
jgi:hypothetical protein